MTIPLHEHAALPGDLDLMMRRGALRRLGLAGLAGLGPLALFGCGGGGDADTTAAGSDGGTSSGGASTSSCSVIPSETAGPYPADGSNSNGSVVVNALALSGIVRSDIRSSVGGASGTAPGVPLTVTLTLVDTGASCAGLAGYAIYLWHCTRDGSYSLYSAGVANENFLRGVQVSDVNGKVSFTTIFPGCYSGRWPHMHFEIYPSLASATSGSMDVKTSQLALPASACHQVYGTAEGYDSSAANLAAISLAGDNVFGDDQAATQVATVTGSVTAGFAASLTLGIAA